MQVIVDYFQLSQMKSCRKEPQRSRNYLLQQRTNSFNKIQNRFLYVSKLSDGLIGVIQNTTAPLWGLKRWCHCTYKGGEAPVRYIEPIGIEALTQQIYKLKGYKTNLPILFSLRFSELASAMPLHRHQHFQDKGGAPRGSYAHNA